ncbi:TonB-dependent receptor [Edaphosphingomonas haloaromaticamans]|uniref:TonB-dependent Receptor Plug Domain protein n=1 Tax=Edaphosphingomonas haloaromaticamans TaxID=653954 RepID=A0A1S1HAG2_9SPHN|nr:TonB-dependent receptor [Sphingomonas haloaromaticamans]OHT19085.1 TonB-dependent Receptor Plug Domain protein [Sphingomonas haloaromaticamans]
MRDVRSNRACGAILRGGASLTVLALVGFGTATQAFAEDQITAANVAITAAEAANAAPAEAADRENPSDIVVVGVRGALASAQNIKKNADTVVDSITATDIGAFPDKSVSEALQRVPGITVSRLQSSDDSTHPSGEPTSVLVRGLPQVRTEFNGRDSFSADASRGLNFNDVSPELMAGVDVYKNQTAEMIEGGIAGTVNLRTRLPFDQDGLLVSGNLKGNYGDRSDKWTTEYSGIVSYSKETDAGRFGLMANYARSHVVTRTESVIMDKIDTYCSAGALAPDGETGIIGPDGNVVCTANPFGGNNWAFIPDGVRFSQVDYDRTRHGVALAAQYENPTGNFRATAQYTQSKYHNAWLERAAHTKFEGGYYGSSAFRPRASSNLGPAPGTGSLIFGADGMLTSGTLTGGTGDWGGSTEDNINRGSAVPGLPFVNYCGAGSNCETQRQGLYLENEARNFDHKENTKDFSFNVKWDPTDRLHASFDVQRITASTDNYDILVATGSMANMQYSVNKDGTPQVNLLPGSNVNYAEGGLANPHNYWMPFIQAHLEDNNAKETALRGDVEYEFDDNSWINSLKVGVRYADRSQTVRYSTFNWTPIAAPYYNCNGPGFNIDNTSPAPYPTACANGRPDFQGYGSGIWESVGLGKDFYNGNVFPNTNLVFMNRKTLQDRQGLPEAVSGPATNSPLPPGWVPICDRPGLPENSCFLPQEVMHVKEKTTAGYIMMRFGGDDKTIFNDVTVQGNVGVRVVHTEITSTGSVGFPTNTDLTRLLESPCGDPLGPNSVVNPACYLTDDILAFADASNLPNTFKTSYTHALPSLNVRFGLDDKQFIRFAASRAISRPDFGLLRNYVSIQTPVIDTAPDSPYVVYTSPDAPHTPENVKGYNFLFRAESGYAALKPVRADQFDLTYERYMGNNSALSVGAFYKKLHGSFSYGEFGREFTNDAGSKQTVLMRGPRNQKGGGELYGVEAAYQTFFDFLPGLLSGLGMQANYTYVHQSGINNSNLVTQGALDAGGTGGFGAGLDVTGNRGAVIDSHRLAGISTHSFNVVGLYEKGPVGFRLAYNWRSRFLTNNLDCCIGLPVFQKSAGFLDGSIRFSVNQFIELSVEASNLLDTKTVYQQQIFGDSIVTPSAKAVYRDAGWNRVDRRFQFGARFKL